MLDTKKIIKVEGIPSWIPFLIIAISILLPYIFGRTGFAYTVLVVGACVATLINPIYKIRLPFFRLLGIFLLVLFFMNVDTIVSAPGINLGDRLISWVLVFPFALYIFKYSPSILGTITKDRRILIFVLFSLIQIVWSFILGNSNFLSIFQRQTYYVLTFLCTVDILINCRKGIELFFFMSLLTGLSTSVILILEYLFSGNLAFSKVMVEVAQRSGGFYGHPGNSAFFVSFCSIICCWLFSIKQISLKIFIPVIFLHFWALGTTFSTQGVLSIILIIIGIGFGLLPKLNGNFFVKTIVVVIAVLLIIPYFSNLVLSSTFVNSIKFSNDNSQRIENAKRIFSGDLDALLEREVETQRTNKMKKTFEVILVNPIVGYGTGASILKKNTYIADSFLPHNVFLLVWLENGILGLGLITFLISFSIIKIFMKSDSERIYRLLLFLNLLFFMNARHTLFYYRYLAIILAFIIILDKISLLRTKPITSTKRNNPIHFLEEKVV